MVQGKCVVHGSQLKAGNVKIERFEDIEAWKKAREVVNSIYQMSRDGEFSKDFALRTQIRRAAISIISNIAEGFSRRSNREFVQFLFVAKASAAEVQSQLYIAMDQCYISNEQFEEIYELLDHCVRQISNFITYLRGRIGHEGN